MLLTVQFGNEIQTKLNKEIQLGRVLGPFPLSTYFLFKL